MVTATTGKEDIMTRWLIDRDHSCASFAIRHLALAYVRGQFNMSGVVEFDPGDTSRAAVTVEIEVASVNTGIRKRDEHLLTSDFFDQPRFPLIAFRSTRIDFIVPNQCRVTGDLTLHGITRSVVFDGEFAGPRGNPLGDETSIGFSGSTTINREDFGIMWGNEPLEGGGLVAGREVQLFLDVEADRET
jgi:polyisoprenoid-binding protein YceI